MYSVHLQQADFEIGSISKTIQNIELFLKLISLLLVGSPGRLSTLTSPKITPTIGFDWDDDFSGTFSRNIYGEACFPVSLLELSFALWLSCLVWNINNLVGYPYPIQMFVCINLHLAWNLILLACHVYIFPIYFPIFSIY